MSIRVSGRTRLHTNEQVVEALRDALRVADEADLDERDRELLLPTIFTFCITHHVQLEALAPGAFEGGTLLG